MRRYRMLTALTVGGLLIGATGARAMHAAPAASTERTEVAATVTAVTVVPGAGSADVVLSITGDVTVNTFTLDGPHRIVVDLRGATMQLRSPIYDRVSRAGIRNVRIGQDRKSVVWERV